MGEFQAFLGIALELQNVVAGLRLTILEGIEQVFQFLHGAFGFCLCLGFAGRCSILQFGARLVQFFLSLSSLLFQFGEQFFSIGQRLGTSIFQMLEQATR
ncbi:hypothetical protein D3C80_1501580 [compost metagenome]